MTDRSKTARESNANAGRRRVVRRVGDKGFCIGRLGGTRWCIRFATILRKHKVRKNELHPEDCQRYTRLTVSVMYAYDRMNVKGPGVLAAAIVPAIISDI